MFETHSTDSVVDIPDDTEVAPDDIEVVEGEHKPAKQYRDDIRVSDQMIIDAITAQGGTANVAQISQEIFGEVTPALRQRLSYHMRKMTRQNQITGKGPNQSRTYTVGGRKTKTAKAPKAPKAPAFTALEVGELFEFIGYAQTPQGGESYVVRSMETQRLYRLTVI